MILKKICVVAIVLAFIVSLLAAITATQKAETQEFQLNELLARELVVGEEVEIISPFSPEGLITVKSDFAVISEKGHGLKVSDIIGALEEKKSITKLVYSGLFIFTDDKERKAVYEQTGSYTLQVCFTDKIVEEGQTLYEIMDGYYVVVPSAPQ